MDSLYKRGYVTWCHIRFTHIAYSVYKGVWYLLFFLFFLFFILPLFYIIVVFICSFFSSIGSFNLPDYFASGSGGSSGPPSNFPGGGGPGPNDFKLKLTHLLAKDTDALADYMWLGLHPGEGSGVFFRMAIL